MNRRTLGVVLLVITLLAVAPQLPRWWPAIATAVSNIDFAATMSALAAMPRKAADFAAARPWLLPALGGMTTCALLALAARALARRSRKQRIARAYARRAVHAAPATTTIPAAIVIPTAAAAAPVAPAPAVVATRSRFAPPSPASAQARAQEPAPVFAFANPPASAATTRSGRRTTVRRLYADGRTVAEIARVTGIGQDAVRVMRNEP